MSTSNGSASANGAPLTQQYSASKSAMAAIFGPGHRYNKEEPTKPQQSGAEPPSGIQGKGTVNEPFDQGNAPENLAGNTPAQSTEEPISGAQGKGTVDEPYDQGNKDETTAGDQPVNTTIQSPPPTTNTETATTTTAQTNGTTTSQSQPAPTSSSSSQPAAAAAAAGGDSTRGRTLAPPSNTQRQERSVSPGTLDDGTHELCGGEKGENYEPSRGLGRLANKLGNQFKSKT
ncbi:uncharacterized protein HMPREF1541_04160 [Cyphellophora europaea CBS 101466]|uniref:Uncharacterized protein n=1 Tax=Cyphellophora europaea (strain CBS 101466) TaxID=1220924 RepID=W2S2M7_CYPE1|nr:uncharacterized protein HMPREF1541_04160 [Cyphellophora europaea CBS 101466]ETN42219.1 hypothetical protein HMPREF1541_04160 [Cyphellophora europaea CBS 101466]